MPYRLIKKRVQPAAASSRLCTARFRHLLSKTLPLLPRSKAGFRHMI